MVDFQTAELLNPSILLRFTEWFLSMVAWSCIVSKSVYNQSGNLVYGVTVLIFFWMVDMIYILIILLGYNKKLNLEDERLGAVNFGISTAGALFIFIGSCCVGASAGEFGVWQAGAAFSFFTCGAWIGSAVFAWRAMRGSFCWQRS